MGHHLVDSKGSKEVLAEAIDTADNTILHILNYKSHYVPLFNPTQRLSLSHTSSGPRFFRQPSNNFATSESVPIDTIEHKEAQSDSGTIALLRSTIELFRPSTPPVMVEDVTGNPEYDSDCEHRLSKTKQSQSQDDQLSFQ